MTESTSKNFQQWTGDASTTAFSMSSVNVQDQSYLAVYLGETLQTITTHYTVAIVSEIATVTMLLAPGTGVRLTVVREEPLEQNTDLTTINTFRAEGFEGALDSIVRQIYRLWHKLSRSLTLPDSNLEGSGQFDARSNRIGNVADPTADQDAVTKLYADGRYALQSSGGGDMFKASYDTDNDGKVNSADSADAVPWSGVSGKPSTFAPSAHTHVGAEITDLATVATTGAYSDLTGSPTIPTVDDTVYGAGWNGDTDAPTKNAVYDKIETLGGGGGAPEGTAVLSTGEVGGTKFLREDGDGTSSWQAISGGGDALVANPLSQFAATTSAQLAGVLSDETGSGVVVFGTSPTIATPTISGDLTTDGLIDARDIATDGAKLDGIATSATANDTDVNLKARTNHTGTQAASTISDFNSSADARISAAIGSTVQAYDAALVSLAGLSLSAGDIIYATAADTYTRLAKGTALQALRMNAGATALEWAAAGGGVFSESFESAEQTITLAGALTIAHGLSSTPTSMELFLVCKTAEFGYSIGDEILYPDQDTTSRSMSVVPDSTNLVCRFGNSILKAVNKTTGGNSTIVASNWKLILRAYA